MTTYKTIQPRGNELKTVEDAVAHLKDGGWIVGVGNSRYGHMIHRYDDERVTTYSPSKTGGDEYDSVHMQSLDGKPIEEWGEYIEGSFDHDDITLYEGDGDKPERLR